jgi:hypothetical protein
VVDVGVDVPHAMNIACKPCFIFLHTSQQEEELATHSPWGNAGEVVLPWLVALAYVTPLVLLQCVYSEQKSALASMTLVVDPVSQEPGTRARGASGCCPTCT